MDTVNDLLRWFLLAGVIYMIFALTSMDDDINDLRERMGRLEGLMETHLIQPHPHATALVPKNDG